MALVKVSVPGPLGMPVAWQDSPLKPGGRIPGPLGFRAIFLADVAAAKVAKAAAVLTLAMPAPLGGAESKIARVVPWALFGTNGPLTTDIAQGGLGDCPLPAILAAMANTPSGRKSILDMVNEHKEAVVTDLSALKGTLSAEQPQGNITSQRYFSVTLGGKSINVSDVFFTDDADSGWSLRYMQAPDKGTPVLWACVIEKAFAVLMGGYAKLNETISVNAIWKIVLGADPHGFSITDKTTLATIKDAAAAAGKVPTILASKDDVNLEKKSKNKVVHDHGYAVLRVRGESVDLYNPWGTPLTLSVAEIKLYFQSMFYP